MINADGQAVDPRDVRTRSMGDIHTLEATEREARQHAKTSPEYIRAAVSRAMSEPIVEHKEAIMREAFYDQRAIEQNAGQHRSEHRFGGVAAWLVVALTACGEAALSYAGLTLAVPDLSQSGGNPILVWITSSGAAFAALAIGLLSAVTTMHVGQQIKAAHRGVFHDPVDR